RALAADYHLDGVITHCQTCRPCRECRCIGPCGHAIQTPLKTKRFRAAGLGHKIRIGFRADGRTDRPIGRERILHQQSRRVGDPNPTSVPAAGDWLRVIALVPLQLSLTAILTETSGTGAWQFSSTLATGMIEQLTLGGVESVTVKLVVQVALLPAASVAITVIVYVPGPTMVLAFGDRLK